MLGIALVASASCGAPAQIPSATGPSADKAVSPTPAAVPPTAGSRPAESADAAKTETPAPLTPIAEDAAFRESSRAACEAARPADAHTLSGPSWPANKVPDRERVHVVLLERRDAAGAAVSPPPLPDGASYYPSQSEEGSVSGTLPMEAEFSEEVDLLACVVFRPGRSQRYIDTGGTLTVQGLDSVVWLVDRATGAPLGVQWVAVAELSVALRRSNLIDLEGGKALVADARRGIVYAMGLAVPLPQLAYQGGGPGWVPTEQGADVTPGARLAPGYTFVVQLVVLRNRAVLEFIDVLCAPGGVVTDTPLRVATAVSHDFGSFSASSADVRIEGEFRSDTLARGTISALSQRARNCGIPASSQWYALAWTNAASDGRGGYTTASGGGAPSAAAPGSAVPATSAPTAVSSPAPAVTHSPAPPPVVATSPAPAPTPSSYSIGQTATLRWTSGASSTIEVTLIAFVDPAQPNEFAEVGADERLVAFRVRIVDRGPAAYNEWPNELATVLDAQGQVHEADTFDPVTPGFSELVLQPGASAEAYIAFVVPRDARLTEFRYRASVFDAETARWLVP